MHFVLRPQLAQSFLTPDRLHRYLCLNFALYCFLVVVINCPSSMTRRNISLLFGLKSGDHSRVHGDGGEQRRDPDV